MKYEKLSKNIIEAVGGSNNIVTLQHCMTRLRFTLKDESKANDQKIEAIDGVLSLIKKGGQYQVVIGTHVHDVYLDVCQIANIKEDENFGNKKEKKGIFNSIFSAIIGCVGPIIPILVGTGLGKCILLFVSMMGWANAETSMTYYVFNLMLALLSCRYLPQWQLQSILNVICIWQLYLAVRWFIHNGVVLFQRLIQNLLEICLVSYLYMECRIHQL